MGRLVISITQKKRLRRLHRIGGCWLKPGVDYLEYEILENEVPVPGTFDLPCRLCWPSGLTLDAEAPQSEDDAEPTSSSSDSQSAAPDVVE